MLLDSLSEHYTACDACRFDEPCATWSTLIADHRRATVTRARYLVAWHNARSTIRRTIADGDSYTSDGVHVGRMLDGLVDGFAHYDPSVVGPAVAQYTATGHVGPAWRTMARRDIPGRYPRLNIP
jgi:hypothetical protein